MRNTFSGARASFWAVLVVAVFLGVLSTGAFAQSTDGRTQVDFGTLGPGESVMLETAAGGLHCAEVETVADFFTLTCTATDGDPLSWECPLQFAEQDVVVCSASTWSALATDPPSPALTWQEARALSWEVFAAWAGVFALMWLARVVSRV